MNHIVVDDGKERTYRGRGEDDDNNEEEEENVNDDA